MAPSAKHPTVRQRNPHPPRPAPTPEKDTQSLKTKPMEPIFYQNCCFEATAHARIRFRRAEV